MQRVIVVAHTTRYREGGEGFARVARTLAHEKARANPRHEIVAQATESKGAFLELLDRATANGRRLAELHFVGHGGMYGPMFGTTKWPEQLSPHEWRTLRLAWAEEGAAYFHTCRSARWFAPFFARTQGVPAHGYHLYTTFSRAPGAFRHELRPSPEDPLYVFGCAGKKSHGLVGSLAKYVGLTRPEAMKRYEPEPVLGSASYDGVAALYDEVFDDIRVRKDEWRYLEARIPAGARVLDVGCGNGALLRALAPRIASGSGVDVSPELLAHARRRKTPQLRFEAIDGPRLPFPDASFDVVVSCLSFRYLDWDPILGEIRRVLTDEGRLLVVDMVAAPLALREAARFAKDKTRELVGRAHNKGYRRALARMVQDPRWQTMLRYNPMRAEHEYVWYLGSRFPRGEMTTLNLGFGARVLGFDSGPMREARLFAESFP